MSFQRYFAQLQEKRRNNSPVTIVKKIPFPYVAILGFIKVWSEQKFPKWLLEYTLPKDNAM